jgi:SpoVK/Ycf46/Vps4 family AAA+-type ATPase
MYFLVITVYVRSLNSSETGSHGNIYNRILSTFLNELDGISVAGSTSDDIEHSNTVIVIATCKSLESLDEALIRPG